jgi:NADH-quinone oxidoreductase subunit J
VLFLFVVMMLDVDFAELRAGFINNAPIGLLVAGIVLVELVALFVTGASGGLPTAIPAAAPGAETVTNTEQIGRVLYTKYVYFFQAAGLVLLVAMIGAIVLTLRHREGVKRQSIAAQNARTPAMGLEVVKVAPGGAVIPSSEAPR